MKGSSGSRRMGNTRPSVSRINQAKKWCFTLNNHTEGDIQQLKNIDGSMVPRIQFREEVGEEGTKHLQGWLEFSTKKRPITIFKKIMGHDRMHWETMRGSIEENITYVTKGQGTGYDRGVPATLQLMTRDKLRPWQLAIADKYVEDENPLFGRHIHWYYEAVGGVGKSILCKYLVHQMGALLLSGANKDALHGVADWVKIKGEGPRMVVFDIPRVNQGHVSYQALEAIKNGRFYSPKYESGMVCINSPHILVFSNEQPDYYSLSEDRWMVEEICP